MLLLLATLLAASTARFRGPLVTYVAKGLYKLVQGAYAQVHAANHGRRSLLSRRLQQRNTPSAKDASPGRLAGRH